MKTKIGAIVCLAAIIISNTSGCGSCPAVCGFPPPTGCTMVFVSYHFPLPGEVPGGRQAQVNSSGCIIPDHVPPTFACGNANNIIVDKIITSPAPNCFNSFDAWNAQDPNMFHDTGEDDGLGDGGWTATAGYDSYGLMLYGPPYGYYAPGNYTAGWNLMISSGFMGSAYFDNTQEVELDVIDVITSQELGYSIITANQWQNMFDYEAFTVPFTITDPNHPIQFRCIWMGQANITVEGCGVAVHEY